MKFLILAAILLSSTPCFSQKVEKQRTCRIVYLERRQGEPEKAHLFDQTTSREVMLPSKNLTDVIKLPAGDLLLGMTPEPVLDPENFPEGAPRLKVPARITDFYLIVVSDPKNKILPLRMILVDAGDGVLKKGETLWINLTTYRIAGKLGKESLIVPAKAKVVGKAPLSDSGYFKARFTYQPNSKSAFLPVMYKSWWFDAKSKNLGFIIKSGGRLPKIFTFIDHRAPASEEEEEESVE